MNESSVSAKLRVALVSLGAVVWKLSDRFHASRPDLLIFNAGKCIVAEVKIHPNKPTKLQEFTLTELYNVNIPTYVITYFPNSKSYLVNSYKSGPTSFTDIRGVTQWLLTSSF